MNPQQAPLLGEGAPARRGMGGHHLSTMSRDEWLTPPSIINALGPFDLDPCAPRIRPWETAAKHYSILDNGLAQPWQGRIWLNPPYGQQTGDWLSRLAQHGNGIALIFARTETAMFFQFVWNRAHGIFFFKGRLHFHTVDGRRAERNSGAPSCLVAYGSANMLAIQTSGLKGVLVPLLA